MDKRQHFRRRVLKGGRVLINDGRSAISCVVRNLSDGGALLRFTPGTSVPDEFVLVISDGATHRCRVVRTDGEEIGVQFATDTPQIDRERREKFHALLEDAVRVCELPQLESVQLGLEFVAREHLGHFALSVQSRNALHDQLDRALDSLILD